MRVLKMLFAVIAILGIDITGGNAQSRWPNTQNVNECTQLTNPDDMRRCIEAYQGAATGATSPKEQRRLLSLPEMIKPDSSSGQSTLPRLAPRHEGGNNEKKGPLLLK